MRTDIPLIGMSTKRKGKVMEKNEEEMKRVANLAKQIYMELEPEEIQQIATDLKQEISNTKIINEIDTSNVDPDVSVLNKCNSLRKDEVIEYENKDGLLSNAKEVKDNMFVIPKIVQN